METGLLNLPPSPVWPCFSFSGTVARCTVETAITTIRRDTALSTVLSAAVAMSFSAVIATVAWTAAAVRAVRVVVRDLVVEGAPIVVESGGSRGSDQNS